MKFRSHPVRLASILAFATCVTTASGSILSVTGNDTLVGNRPANLITNGSFEADAGVAANLSYWATGTTNLPTMSLTAWTATGISNTYANWGSDGLGGLELSAPLPHGTNGLYFGAGIMAGVSPYPTEAPNGLVTFSSLPVIVPKPDEGPVTLEQTVSGLNPSYAYVLDFWTSGEEVGSPSMQEDGFFGLDITGESRLYFAAASGAGPIGNSQRYQVYFTPTASTVTFRWINWGHYFGPNGMSDELVLDDVILNQLTNTAPAQCNCFTNLTVTCPGIVPDFCAIAVNCLGTNMLPGSCAQNPPPGTQLSAGTYPIAVSFMDWQSNYVNCLVTMTVQAPVPAPPLTVICPTNKTVECNTQWNFDSPVIVSSCCGVTVTSSDAVLSQTACSEVIERTWQITDGCGNTTTCSQKVTTVDTTPPGRPCGINMVPNGSFERTTNCAGTISQFDFASPWFTPTDATTDLYSSCGGPWTFVSTPTNGVGYEIPSSGQNYAGAVIWSTYGLNTNNTYRDYREYLEVPLRATLVGGARYQVSFYVSRADNYRYAIAEIGAYFSRLPLQTNGYYRNFNVVPQVENSPTNLLTSTNGWTLIQGTFVASGNEEYLTLGNFRTDANTTWTNANPSAPLPDYAYYYFDDVSVTMICDPITNKVVECGQPWDWDLHNLSFFDNCSGINVTVNTTTTISSYCPTVTTREWGITDACGNTNYFSQTITNVDTTPPKLQCAAGANLVPNPQFEGFAACPYNISQLPTAGPWFNPTVATPDYYNSCTASWPVSTPANLVGNQTPFSGAGYAGIYAYTRYNTNPPGGYREYIEAPLLGTLQPGVTYQVSFRVSLADLSAYAIADLGAYLSVGQLVNGSTNGVLNVVPQLANPTNNVLNSTNTWTLIQGTFTAAGGENHITIGNFKSDANTTFAVHLGTNTPLNDLKQAAYYYIDDVAVTPLCSFTNKTVLCGTQWDFDTPLAYDECSGDFLSVFVTTNWTTGVCPKTHTRVWTIYDSCQNFITATQSVTELDFTPPVLLCNGLNLLPNGDFENYFLCPPAFSFLSYAQPWQGLSSEFFHTCATFASGVSVPGNFIGTQTPFSGSGYGGCYVFFNSGNSSNSIREYLESPLMAPLIAGQAYTVSFRVSRADNSSHAIAEIGAAFSTGNVSNYFALTPQVVNPSANILTNSTGWTLVSGTFVASGGENTLTLGNFLQDAFTTAQFIGPAPINNTAYYYFDDVKVIALCTNVPVKNIACGEPLNFDPAPLAVDACGGNVTVTLAGTVTNSTCPLSVSRVWTLADACNNATNWAQTINVTNNSPFAVNCECLMDALLGQLTTNNTCNGILPLVTIPSNSPCITGGCGPLIVTQSPPPGTPVGVGQHNITLNISKCTGVTNQCVVPFSVNPPAPTITCPPTIFVIGCSNNSAIVNYAATAVGNVGPIVYSPPSGSIFPLGTNLVSCTATSSCGGVAVCYFNVVVKPVPKKFPCFTRLIDIISFPPPVGRIIHLPPFPGGGFGADLEGLDGTDGIRLDIGPAEKFTFGTVLDFNAPSNASFELHLPPGAGTTTATPLVRFERSCDTNCGWNIRLAPQIVSDPAATFRAAAISDEGELFDSVLVPRDALDTNIFASIKPMDGNTNALLTVTFDLRTREVSLGLPNCDWTPSARHKGWDGCIYGNPKPRPTGTNKTARVIITPPGTLPPPPITELTLAVSHLDTLAFDNPVITMSGRKWSDGHVTLIKAYDDGAERGIEFFALGNEGGGIEAELGHATSFQMRMTSLDTNGLPLLEQNFSIRGWPPLTTTNRPPPPVINVRLAPDNSGLGGVHLGADFVDWGVSQVTLQLWNGTTLVGETLHVPLGTGDPLCTLGGFPGILGCPGVGVVSLSDTNPIVVLSGMTCGTLGCVGTELRIIAEPSTMFTPPTAHTGVTATIGEDMDYLIHALQTTPACTPVPLHVDATTDGVTLSWSGDGFHLQGAESVEGPWYDLEVESPATIPAGAKARVFRLRCD